MAKHRREEIISDGENYLERVAFCTSLRPIKGTEEWKESDLERKSVRKQTNVALVSSRDSSIKKVGQVGIIEKNE